MTITAKIIADSISEDDVRITTLQLRYPRFIHSEFMTHRVFSRNASSSRAIPVERLIEDIERETAMPIHWGKNQPGMQAREEHDEELKIDAYLPKYSKIDAWIRARNNAIEVARAFHNAGYHKQIVNRLLEPFSHINVVVTSTEWENFFKLRRHPDAQPEIKVLADVMYDVIQQSKPYLIYNKEWHLPYITENGLEIEKAIKCSVARCARVSYLTHEGKPTNIENDLLLYERLINAIPPHMSPAEHQATPDKFLYDVVMWNQPTLHGNFIGWKQYRKVIENAPNKSK